MYKRYQLDDIRKRLWLALQVLYIHDRYLIDKRIWECALSHRLAVYIEHGFPEWHTDCEFNKYGTEPKLAECAQESKRPDIIVHLRGETGPNLLAIELKKKSSIDDDDRKKAKRYIDELGYRWAVCISVNSEGPLCEWQGEGIDRYSLDTQVWAEMKESGYIG